MPYGLVTTTVGAPGLAVAGSVWAILKWHTSNSSKSSSKRTAGNFVIFILNLKCLSVKHFEIENLKWLRQLPKLFEKRVKTKQWSNEWCQYKSIKLELYFFMYIRIVLKVRHNSSSVYIIYMNKVNIFYKLFLFVVLEKYFDFVVISLNSLIRVVYENMGF